MKILIIGAGGMVGQKLVQKIIEPGFNSFNFEEWFLLDLYLPNYKDLRIKRIIGSINNKKKLKIYRLKDLILFFI